MSLTVVKDHEEQGIDLLLDQYRNKVRLEAWLRIYLRQVQLLEDATYDVLISRMIDYAKNAQLDVLGKIVGEHRKGREDEDYRLFIRLRILINRSAGTPPDLLGALSLLSSPTPVHFDDYYPASFLIEFEEIPERELSTIYNVLQEMRGGGIRLNFVAPTIHPELQFLYSSVGDEDESDHGYGDVNDPHLFGLMSTALGPGARPPAVVVADPFTNRLGSSLSGLGQIVLGTTPSDPDFTGQLGGSESRPNNILLGTL